MSFLHLRAQLRVLRASLAGQPALRTSRACDWSRVRVALRAAAGAKKRVRVYAGSGFVPNSYKWKCQIQYIEVLLTDGKATSIYANWTGAQRPRGQGSLVVVQ
jgi:hypothetical protein